MTFNILMNNNNNKYINNKYNNNKYTNKVQYNIF